MNLLSLSTAEFLLHVDKQLSSFDYAIHPAAPLARADWEKLVKAGVLLPVIPRIYGGRENHQEICYILQQAARYNLSLAMYMLTPVLLFLRNVIAYGDETLKREVIEDMQHNSCLGGYAIVEPDASGLLQMQTTFEEVEGGYHINGKKHWQCFSTTADWWLLLAKHKYNGEGEDKFEFFAYKRTDGGFTTRQVYEPIGLRFIDYGLNELDVFVPAYRRLGITISPTGLLNFISGVWHQWAAIGSGFLTRISDEAVSYAGERRTTNGLLLNLGHVQYSIGLIHASRNLSKALFQYILSLDDPGNINGERIFAMQAIKVLTGDHMFNAARNYQQLCGAEGYRYNATGNIAACALLDAMGFSILGGANDLLYDRLAQYFISLHGRQGYTSFLSMIHDDVYTREAADFVEAYASMLDKIPVSNTEMVAAGKILARLFGITAVLQFGAAAGLSDKEVSAVVQLCGAEIANVLTGLSIADKVSIEQK